MLALDADGSEDESESIEEQFDADLLMMTTDFGELLGDLVQALGGVTPAATDAAIAA